MIVNSCFLLPRPTATPFYIEGEPKLRTHYLLIINFYLFNLMNFINLMNL